MARQRTPSPPPPSEVLLELKRLDVGSAVALVGHPIHVMMVHFPIAFVMATLVIDLAYWWSGDVFFVRAGLWSTGVAFWMGMAASLVGIAELLLVRGIRLHEASWSHAVAAMTMLAVTAANWRLRVLVPDDVLPHALALSLLGAVFAGFAGFHGGKLVFEHGIGTNLSPEPEAGQASDPAAHPTHLG